MAIRVFVSLLRSILDHVTGGGRGGGHGHNLVNIQARSSIFCIVEDKALKYRLISGVKSCGFGYVRQGSCTKIAINHSIETSQGAHSVNGGSLTKIPIT